VQFSNKVSLFSDGFFLSIVTTDDKNGVWLFLSTLRPLLFVKFDKLMVVKYEGKEKERGKLFLAFSRQKAVKIRTLLWPYLVFISHTSVCPSVTPIKIDHHNFIFCFYVVLLKSVKFR
jgi:hypothetical protein